MAIMRARHTILAASLAALLGIFVSQGLSAPPEQLAYHEIKTDASGKIIPWYSPDAGEAYNHIILKIWDFWKNMKSCPNGVKYYMQHQVWNDPEEDPRALGGDQLAMALSSWTLLYAYTGDRSVVENMQYIADYVHRPRPLQTHGALAQSLLSLQHGAPLRRLRRRHARGQRRPAARQGGFLRR